MTVNYYLDKPKSTEETAIYLFIRQAQKKIKINTGQRIHPKFWNGQKDSPIKKSYTGSPEFNYFLNTLKANVQKLIRTRPIDVKNYSLEDLREDVMKLLGEVKPIETKGFFDVYEEFMESRAASKSKATSKKYRTLFNHLQSFSQTTKFKLSFDTIDHKFEEKFIYYSITVLGHTNNYIAKILTVLKTFMHWATDREYNTKLAFKKFKVPSEQIEIIYLTWSELMALYNLDLSKSLRLAKVRDSICLACFTGQRDSDISNFDSDQVKSNIWYIRTQKTNDLIQVPLNEYALDIVSRYQGVRKPFKMSNQKKNQYLKEIGVLAEINDPVTKTKFRGSEKIHTTLPKHELLSTHIGRRTFVTLSLEKGMRPETVMEITGHKDYKTFKKYIKITSKVKEIEMQAIWSKEPSMKIA